MSNDRLQALRRELTIYSGYSPRAQQRLSERISAVQAEILAILEGRRTDGRPCNS
jgi:hypothetical protein